MGPRTSDEETLSALTDLQRAGKIRHFGSSTFPAYRLVEAQWAARDNHLSRYVTEQPSYSILQRGVETHVLPVTEQYGLGVLAWSPLASGWLSGAIRAGRDITTSRSTFMPQRFDPTVPANRARLDAVEQLATVAAEAGLSMIQLALGFVTAHPAVTSAIIGPRTMDHLHSQLAAADTVLSADVLDTIDAIVAPGVDLAAHEKNDPGLARRGSASAFRTGALPGRPPTPPCRAPRTRRGPSPRRRQVRKSHQAGRSDGGSGDTAPIVPCANLRRVSIGAGAGLRRIALRAMGFPGRASRGCEDSFVGSWFVDDDRLVAEVGDHGQPAAEGLDVGHQRANFRGGQLSALNL